MATTLARNGTLYRSVPVCVRGLDVEKRTATFVASTENPVDTMWGREVLRMDGVDLTRFGGGGPFLDAHDGSTIDNVLGSGSAQVVGRELEFVAQFDDEGKGARAWNLVRKGHVRTVSIGYRIDPTSVRRLKEGETDGQGTAQVRGPAVVVRRWELLEVSLVPVPADRDATLRSALFNTTEGRMADQKDQAAERPTDAGTPQNGSVYSAAVAAAPKPDVRATADADTREAARAAAIRALAPADLREFADDLVLEGLGVEDARKRLLEERAKRSKPLGTPEPKTTTNQSRLAAISDEDLLASIRRAF
jgi:hypothetical protein